MFAHNPIRFRRARRASQARVTVIMVAAVLLSVLVPALHPSPSIAISGSINDDGVDIGDDWIVPGWPGSDGSDGSPGGSGWLGPYLPGIPPGLLRAYCVALLIPPPWCLDVEPIAPTPPEPDVPDLTLSDLVRVEPLSPTLTTEPAGWSVVGVETNLIAQIETHVVDAVVLGRAVEVRFTPVRFDWDYGDGQTGQTDVRGTTWSQLAQPPFTATATSHRYVSAQPVTPLVEVTYRVDYRRPGDDWIRVNGSLSRRAIAPVVFVQNVDTVLVTNDCRITPHAIGCDSG